MDARNAHKPRVLFVDDEPHVLEALRRHLRGANVEATFAIGGAEGLAALEQSEFAVVISDFQMPAMNGAAFLNKCRERAPEAVRILLTGLADIEAAMAAVNEGNVFRILRKPCATSQLLAAMQSGIEQHRLLTAERELKERTLRGAVEALGEMLALTSPSAFGAVQRVRQLVADAVRALGLANGWELDVAVTMSRLGAATLPDAVLEKLNGGRPLSQHEQAMVAEMPAIAQKLLSKIPRLDGVAEIIQHQQLRFDGRNSPPRAPRGPSLPLGARLLKVAFDFDALTMRGMTPGQAMAALSQAGSAYDQELVHLLGELRKPEERPPIQVTLEQLGVGMVLAAPVRLKNDLLLIAEGHLVTAALLARLHNYCDQLSGPLLIRQPEEVSVRNAAA